MIHRSLFRDDRAHQERKLTAEVSAKRLAEQAAWWDKNKEYLKEAGIDFYMHNNTGCQEVRLENPSMEPTMPDSKSDSYTALGLTTPMSKCEPEPPHDPLQTSLVLQQAVIDYAQAIKNVKQLTQSLEEAKKTLNQRHTETMNIINTQYYKFQEWIEVQRSTIEP